MRIGFNPHKDQEETKSEFYHQVIVPVYIPNFKGYFKDSFIIFKLCLQSIFDTTHNKTFITIVNNGSCEIVKDYLNELFLQGKIHEVIQTQNIGKLNAILKGLAGNNIELVTVTDADVLFLQGWQSETIKIFSNVTKAGVVGIVPAFNLHKTNSFNLIFDNLFNPKMCFIPVKNPKSMTKFYESIGWNNNFNQNYLKYNLGFLHSENLTFLVGSSHFVATYKKDIFNNIISNIPFKMGGNSESFLDEKPLDKDYWRVTTYDNFAFHMGNTPEDWMFHVNDDLPNRKEENIPNNFNKLHEISKLKFIIKNKLLQKILKNKFFYKMFLRYKKLPTIMVSNY